MDSTNVNTKAENTVVYVFRCLSTSPTYTQTRTDLLARSFFLVHIMMVATVLPNVMEERTMIHGYRSASLMERPSLGASKSMAAQDVSNKTN